LTIFDFLRRQIAGEPKLHPAEKQIAKRWVKERLKLVYPELRNDPKALEKAYQELSLQPREGAGEGGETEFEVVLPDDLDEPKGQWNS